MSANQTLELLAPLSGLLVPLEAVPDPVFAGKLVGDGISIDPTSQTLCAPMAGVVGQLQASGHALSLIGEAGVEVLMHIGLDTVQLQGAGFRCLVQSGEQVAAGQPLIEFDADAIAQSARSLLTQMLVVNGEKVSAYTAKTGLIECGQPVLSLTLSTTDDAVQSEQQGAVQRLSGLVAVPNPSGLHARPAAILAHAAKGFAARISLHKGSQEANAKSLVAIMALEVTCGDALEVRAYGADAEQAVTRLRELIAEGCGEGIEPVRQAQADKQTAAAPVQPGDGQLRGVCASPGLALGWVVQIAEPELSLDELGQGETLELQHLRQGLATAWEQLASMRLAQAGGPQVEILQAHQELLEDPDLLEQAEAMIAAGKSAAFAWYRACMSSAERLADLQNALLAERAQDLRDVGQRVARCLQGESDGPLQLPEQSILIAEQLSPSQTASLDTSKVLGLVTVGGGPTSHVAILARALNIPALCGLPAQVLALASGTQVLLDGNSGLLRVAPSASEVEELYAELRADRQRQRLERDAALLPATTRDDCRIEVSANVASLEEVRQALDLGGEGVGLLRSEFLYLHRDAAPNEAEQRETYRAIAAALGAERNLVVRTLDVGGDKPLPYVPMAAEENPFLGMRGIRLCLQRPELLRSQLRAVLGAAELSRLHLMLPMVANLEELREVRGMLEQEAAVLGVAQLPKLGIMVEVPAAALLAEQFAAEVDFFSIGTNDLTQYCLAMDRGHPRLAAQADALHPGVLRLIELTVRGAHAHGKWVGLCGGLASEPLAVPLLLGLGVDELSVSVPAIPAIKAAVRRQHMGDCRLLAKEILAMGTIAQVRQRLLEVSRSVTERSAEYV
nr:phosphoenolpyruvate--protein phosphotransferase [uncultured Pseudomonas sp.]